MNVRNGDELRSFSPLVSILTPCFNSVSTLPWALASVYAQSYENWELVIVDDGSSDESGELLETQQDSRVRVIVLPKNLGRGAARQVALSNVMGEYVCMVDADDWMFPNRIERQVEVLRCKPEVSMVSATMAIANEQEQIVGVRGTATNGEMKPFSGVKIPAPFAASMIRMSAIGEHGFDPSMRFAEDTDFIIRVLNGKYFEVLPEPLYACREAATGSASKSADAMKYFRQYLLKHKRNHPLQVSREYLTTIPKEVVYRGASILGVDDNILRRRNRPPSEFEVAAYYQARDVVGKVLLQNFSATPFF